MRLVLGFTFLILTLDCVGQNAVLHCQGAGVNNLAAFRLFKSGSFLGLDCGSSCNSVTIQTYPVEGDCLEESWLINGRPADLTEIGTHLFCLQLPGPGEYLISHTLSFEQVDNTLASYEAECSYTIDPCCENQFDFKIRVIDQVDNILKFSLVFSDDLLQQIKEVEVSDADSILYVGSGFETMYETRFGGQIDRVCVKATFSDDCIFRKCIRLTKLPGSLESSRPTASPFSQPRSSKVWPIPAENRFFIETTDFSHEPFSVVILNNLGQVVTTNHFDANTVESVIAVDATSFLSGCYYLYLSIANRRPQIFRVIIVKSI